MEQSDEDLLEKIAKEKEQRKQANELQKGIDSFQKELNDLQEKCEHLQTIVKQKPGGNVKKYCKICDKYLTYLTEKELEIYLHGNDRSIRKDREH